MAPAQKNSVILPKACMAICMLPPTTPQLLARAVVKMKNVNLRDALCSYQVKVLCNAIMSEKELEDAKTLKTWRMFWIHSTD